MSKALLKFSLPLSCMAALTCSFTSTPAIAQQPSNFQNSCQNIRYGTDTRGTPVIQASCRTKNGSVVESAVAIRGFHNSEGRISAGAGTSSFQNSCRNMKIAMREGHVWLDASCRTTDGQYVDSSAKIYDISNEDGTLRHRVPGNDTIVMNNEPPRACSTAGNMFNAEFINQTQGPVTFHWMGFDCKEGGGPKLAVGAKDYGSVGNGHIFRVRDASGKLIGTVTASAASPQIIAR